MSHEWWDCGEMCVFTLRVQCKNRALLQDQFQCKNRALLQDQFQCKNRALLHDQLQFKNQSLSAESRVSLWWNFNEYTGLFRMPFNLNPNS